jgi:hypothetical protein
MAAGGRFRRSAIVAVLLPAAARARNRASSSDDHGCEGRLLISLRFSPKGNKTGRRCDITDPALVRPIPAAATAASFDPPRSEHHPSATSDRAQPDFRQGPNCCAAPNPVISGESGTKPRRVAVSERFTRCSPISSIAWGSAYREAHGRSRNTDVEGKCMIRALEAAGLAWLMFNGALLVSMNREDVWQPTSSITQ